MSSKTAHKTRTRSGTTPQTRPRPSGSRKSRRARAARIKLSIGAVVVVGALFGVYYSGVRTPAPHMNHDASAVAGEPGRGAIAPPFTLAAAQGGVFDLRALQGSTVLLFFQEGLMCRPCWDQLSEIEAAWDRFEALGIDAVASISHDRLDSLRELLRIDAFSTPLLSDPDLVVSRAYDTPRYGMHPGSTNGHSFVVVGDEGIIRWRADYGGPPAYSMYIPLDQLLTDLEDGLS